MKIKKVEIARFRAFNRPEDSTFDFVLENGQVANFVSIYAPNGFGKTSFYDAVEWGITGQIERFHRAYTEYEKSAKEDDSPQSDFPVFLQHHDALKERGYVKILIDNNEYLRKIPDSKKYDFKSPGERPFFKEVILSQELIDSFIKEEKGEERYKRFVESFPQLNSYNQKLQNLSKLQTEIKEVIKKISNARNEKERIIQLKIDFDNAEGILEDINNSILFVQNEGYKLDIIRADFFTEKEYQILSNRLQTHKTTVENDLNTCIKKLDGFHKIYNGSHDDKICIGIIAYFDACKQYDLLVLKYDDYKIIVTLTNVIKSDVSKIEKEQRNIFEAEKLKTLFQASLNMIDRIQYLITGAKVDTENLRKARTEFEQKKTEKSDLENQRNSIELYLNSGREKIQKAVANQKRIEEIKERIKEIGSVDVIDIHIEEVEKMALKLRDRLNVYKNFKEKQDINLIKSDIGLVQENELFNRIIGIESIDEDLRKQILEVNQQIEAQEELNNDLKEFLARGLELVTLNKDRTCPLCSHSYSSYEELHNKISRNDLLSTTLKRLFAKRKELDEQRMKVLSDLNTLKNILLQKVEQIDAQIKKDYEELEEKRGVLVALKNELKQLIQEKDDLLLIFGGKGEQEFFEEENKNIGNWSKEFTVINDKISVKGNEINNSEFIIKKMEENISQNENEKNSLEKNEKFLLIKKFFAEVLDRADIEYEAIDRYITDIKNVVKNLKEENRRREEYINSKKNTWNIGDVETKEIEAEIIVIDQDKLQLQKVIQNYEQFVKSNCGIELQHVSKEEIDNHFHKLESDIKQKIDKQEEILKHLKIIDVLRESTYSYLTVTKTQKEISHLKSRLSVLERIKDDFDKEKKHLQEFLKKKIDNFFYTELINKIYQKIDPHPDYEAVKFDCDFAGVNPRLQIYTKDKKGNYSVPALYFSTAQINILSMSIFLARALKAVDFEGKPIKCIFIDDPIQSMDSINILSFIDLFRSLTVNLDRQIIVSTHEENFHLLLQKKIPSELFDAKYIEFETFGKVKRN